MKQLLKRLKFTVIENYVYAGKDYMELPVLHLPHYFTLKIFDDETSAGINIIDSHKKPDNTCYAVFDNDTLAHISWVYKKNLLLRQLGYNDYYYAVGSFTYPSYRGRGIYPAVLNTIMRKYPGKRLLGFVDTQNYSSVSAFQKAGFIRSYRFKMIRFLGAKIYLKKYAE